MDKLRAELYIINRVLSKMYYWTYLTVEKEEMLKELEKRKEFLEFLLENA